MTDLVEFDTIPRNWESTTVTTKNHSAQLYIPTGTFHQRSGCRGPACLGGAVRSGCGRTATLVMSDGIIRRLLLLIAKLEEAGSCVLNAGLVCEWGHKRH